MGENIKRLRHAGPGCVSSAELDELVAQGWYPAFQYLGYFSVWVRRTGGGGECDCDLTEVMNRLEGLDIAIDVIGQVHDQFRLEIDELKQSGGGTSGMTREIDVAIYSDDTLLPPGAIKRAKGFIKDEILAAYFTIDDGAKVPEGTCYYIVPSEGPSGYAGQFLGKATFHGGSHGDVIHGISSWGKAAGKWGVRMQSPNYDLFEKILGINYDKYHTGLERKVRIAGGDAWWGKRFPLVVRSDTIRITIPMP